MFGKWKQLGVMIVIRSCNTRYGHHLGAQSNGVCVVSCSPQLGRHIQCCLLTNHLSTLLTCNHLRGNDSAFDTIHDAFSKQSQTFFFFFFCIT